MRSTIVRAIGCLTVMALALGLAACGADGGSSAASGPERYCELVAELEKLGSEAFDEVAADENATEADFFAANKAFYESSQAEFDEMIRVAPAEIKPDVEILVESIRGQAGLVEEVPAEEASAAEERIVSYEDENC